jgi:hypothetical protein
MSTPARVHIAARRRGGRVAACGARAAGREPEVGFLSDCSRIDGFWHIRWARRGAPVNTFLKTILVLMLAIAAFNLGRYSVEFSGSGAAWTAVGSSLVIVAASLFALLRDFWKSNA